MKAVSSFIICAILLCSGMVIAQSGPGQQTTAPAASKTEYVPVHEYDSKRDAAADIKEAVAVAAQTHRRVLVEIGGKWCIWCTYLDKFFAQNTELRQFRDANFVMVKVNFSPENKNEKVISQYGGAPGYPHIVVLDADGKMLHAQDTSKLEEGRGYSVPAITKFMEEWKPKS
jgi:thiol:disulfide interchange protein